MANINQQLDDLVSKTVKWEKATTQREEKRAELQKKFLASSDGLVEGLLEKGKALLGDDVNSVLNDAGVT